MIEILENEERQLQALWACPTLSSSTRLLLDAFLRVAAAEAFVAAAADVSSSSNNKSSNKSSSSSNNNSSKGKKEKDPKRREKREEDEEQQELLQLQPVSVHPRRRLLFASCCDLFEWPRQAAFLIAASQLQGWRLHSELIPVDDEETLKPPAAPASAAAAAADAAVNGAHVDAGFGRIFAERCPCRDTVPAAGAAAAQQQQQGQHYFYALSEGLLLQQIPAQQQRQRLLQDLTPQQRELLPPGWLNERAWMDILNDIAAAAAAEVYAHLPSLPQLLEHPPRSLIDDEFCGLGIQSAVSLHAKLQEYASA